jgi:hypothetical protein
MAMLACATIASAQAPQLLDRVLAVVSGSVVTLSWWTFRAAGIRWPSASRG